MTGEGRIENIIFTNRRVGSSLWIVKSAIKYPDCIIIARDKEMSTHLKRKYFEIIDNYPIYILLWWKITKRKHPLFLTINDNIFGYGKPIIFDNSAFV